VTNDLSAPSSKRQKRNNGVSADTSEEEVGAWTPKGNNWENEVERVENIEKDDNGGLMVFLKFKNGRRTKVTRDMVYKHCPRPMLIFYEEHLKFK
jgi:chromobox protein 1